MAVKISKTQVMAAVIIVAVIAAAGVLYLLPKTIGSLAYYPQPTRMPPVVDEDFERILSRLEGILTETFPDVADSLQPGLTDSEIDALEERYGFPLTDELRQLYGWHNGSSSGQVLDFIPGHRFLPLNDAVDGAVYMRTRGEKETVVQRAAFEAFAGHTTNWLSILDDGAGDGYSYDPERISTGGEIFNSFMQTGEYTFFPSLKNLFAGIVENFETGAYTTSEDNGFLDEDFDQSYAIWPKYGQQIVD